MKKLILLLIVLASCSADKSKLDTNIETWVKTNAHNPDSYEPINTTFKDTIFVLDTLNNKIIAFSGMPDKFLIDRVKDAQREKDSIINSPEPNPIIGYLFIHSCRIDVPLGGKMLKDIEVLTDINFDIIAANEIKY